MARPGRFAKALAARLRRRLRAAGQRAAARRACALARPARIEGSVEPLALGDHDTAHALARGDVAFDGARTALNGRSPFVVAPPSPGWRDALHGFNWIEQALAAGREDRLVLTEWAFDWLRRHGAGSGPGWTPELAGRRAARLAAAARMLAEGAPLRRRKRLARALRAHMVFLAARGPLAETPRGRVEAAGGLVLAGLVDAQAGRLLTRGIAELGRAAEQAVDRDGGVASRDPDELAAVFEVLAWTAHALTEAGRAPEARHLHALRRAGPALRALRLGDGSLARFHGGRGGAEFALDQALALAGGHARGPRREAAMGYHRIAGGGLVALIDGAPPPAGPRAAASALGLEISVGRRLLTGAIGCGAALDGEWAVAARATAAHCALEVDGASAARLEPDGFASRALGRGLAQAARNVSVERLRDARGQWLRAAHDGYRARFGLIVTRRLHLAADGAALSGEDAVEAPDLDARLRFDRAAHEGGLPFVVRFHLPPDVDAVMVEENAARLTLDAGERWTVSASGGALRLEEGVWIAPGAAAPQTTLQLAILGRAEAYWGRVGWRIAREPVERPRRAEAAARA